MAPVRNSNSAHAFTSWEAFFYYAVLVASWIVIVKTISYISLPYLKHSLALSLGLGTAIWLYGMAKTLTFFMVSVPEVTGLVTVNLLNGNMKSYGTGLNFHYPWEQVKDGNFINLRTAKTDDKEETFPCEDGPVVIVKWSLQYRSSVEQLPAYIAVDEETINKGLNEVASSFLAVQIKGTKSEDIRAKSKKDVLEKDLLKHFNEAAKVPGHRNGGTSTPLEEFYGIRIMLVTIADVDFEADYQKARSTEQMMVKFKETATKLTKDGDGSISDKDALDSVLMVAGKGVTKNVVQETKVLEVAPALGEVLKEAAKILSTKK